MIRQVFQIEFLTPCFCAGAEPSRAELRASAIRGQLRWWYRALGGSKDQEKKVFGGVHGDSPCASRLLVRVVRPPSGGDAGWVNSIPRQGTAQAVYLQGFFCGRTGRLQRSGAIAPGAQTEVEILHRHPPDELTRLAIRAFFSMGALGFRATRAAGALTSRECALTGQSWDDLKQDLESKKFKVYLLNQVFDGWHRVIVQAGELLKGKLRGRDGLRISAGRNGSRVNVLGSASPRQASVLHLRPVRIDGRLKLALIEAPHDRILGNAARQAAGGMQSVIGEAMRRRLL